MIQDLDESVIPMVINADLCIVGAGIAGLALASEFTNTSTSVAVLEAGGESFDSREQSLFDASISGATYRGHIDGRYRVFGGSSIKWGGALLPLNSEDFLRRPYIANSGWPISLEDLAPFYRRAETIFKVDSLPYDSSLQEIMGFATADMDSASFRFRYSKWSAFKHRNFATNLGPACKRAKNINVLLHGTATNIALSSDGTEVVQITARSLSGRTARIHARYFVLCCGTLETTRLLLASNQRFPQGVGNGTGMVGRFFQDHISYRAAELFPLQRERLAEGFMARFRRRVMRYPRLELTSKKQNELQCLSVFGQLNPESPEGSGFALMRSLLRARQSRLDKLPSLRKAFDAVRDAPYIFLLAKAYLLGGRLALPPNVRWYLQVDVEQEPSADSVVSLTDARDVLDMPKLDIHWRIGERERATVQQFVSIFRTEWERLGLGQANWNTAVDVVGPEWLAHCRDAFHQVGTTRMSNDPRSGVVGDDLRVHGIRNLFIGSCSVFPTSGSANPTFTLVALCIRLAERLKKLIALPSAELST